MRLQNSSTKKQLRRWEASQWKTQIHVVWANKKVNSGGDPVLLLDRVTLSTALSFVRLTFSVLLVCVVKRGNAKLNDCTCSHVIFRLSSQQANKDWLNYYKHVQGCALRKVPVVGCPKSLNPWNPGSPAYTSMFSARANISLSPKGKSKSPGATGWY